MRINTPERLLVALGILEQNLPNFQEVVNATEEEMTFVGQYRANLAQAIRNDLLIERDKQASTGIKNAVYKGDRRVPASKYPSFDIAPLPYPDLPGGADGFYRQLRQRYKSSRGFTEAVSVALGFETVDGNRISPDTLVGAANLKRLNGYEYRADFLKKGASGMFFQHRVSGTEKWIDAKTAISSPVIIKSDTLEIEGAAVLIEVRCRPMKGNDLVGQWSPIYSLTVNP